MNKKIRSIILALVSLGMNAWPALAISADPVQEAGQYRVQNQGAQQWVIGPQIGANATPAADGAGSLGIYNVAGSSWALTISSGTEAFFYGPVGLPIFSSTQLQNTTLGQGIPRRVGLLVYNTSLSVVCVSTAATQGSYRMTISTGGAPATQSSGQCF